MVNWLFPEVAVTPAGAAGAEFPQLIKITEIKRRTAITEEHNLNIFISRDLFDKLDAVVKKNRLAPKFTHEFATHHLVI
jgi:hypothetical protein